MSMYSVRRTVKATMVQASGPCHLLELPLELRDIIYGMLLTTPYCTNLSRRTLPTTLDDTDNESLFAESYWKFHLHIPILLVNRQISAEATRIFYEENDFILLKINGMHLNLGQVPAFSNLLEKKITSPVLRIEFSVDDASHAPEVASQSLLTTAEGLQSIIEAMWLQEDGRSDSIHHTSSTLTLVFNLRAASRQRALAELLTNPWDSISVKKLVLVGDIKQPLREQLEKSNLKGPFSNDVAAHLAEYNSLAELAFKQGDYDAAQWWWTLLDEHLLYVAHLEPHHLREGKRRICRENDELCKVLRRSYLTCYNGLMKLVKACLWQSRYKEADGYITAAFSRRVVDKLVAGWFGSRKTPIMNAKLQLCACLALTARGMGANGMSNLRAAVYSIGDSLNHSGDLYPDLKPFKDLKQTVNNELIRVGSLWRCGVKTSLSLTPQSGPEWQVGVVWRSFWEWMELPDESRDDVGLESD